MGAYYERHGVTVYAGDCLNVLTELDDCSVDAIVTDPPYGLAEHKPAALITALTAWANGDREHVPDGKGFMGRDWDAFVPPPAVWDECLRVLKPGGHLLAFAGSRTADLMGLSVRMAGFEIRDTIMWIYGGGFPHGINVSKAIDRQRDDQDDIVAVTRWVRDARNRSGMTNAQVDAAMGTAAMSDRWTRTTATKAAMPTWEQWLRLRDVLGFGGHPDEPAVSAEVWRLNGRKGTPGDAWAEREVIGEGFRVRRPSNVQIAGLSDGAFNLTTSATVAARQWEGWNTSLRPAQEPIIVARKPLSGTVAATVLEHGTGALNIGACRTGDGAGVVTFDRRAGDRSREEYRTGTVANQQPSGQGRWPSNVVFTHAPDCVEGGACVSGCPVADLDQQSGILHSQNPATRASKSKRVGATGFGTGDSIEYADKGGASRFFPVFRYQAKAPSRERPEVDGVKHPTVKPLALMQWLVRLVTPPDGLVLDPFAGSGTTLHAARAEGMRAIGIEREPDYLRLIAARLDARPRAEKAAAPVPVDEPMDLLDLLGGEVA